MGEWQRTEVANRETRDQFYSVLIFSFLHLCFLGPFLLCDLLLLSQHRAQGAPLLQFLTIQGPLAVGWSFTSQGLQPRCFTFKHLCSRWKSLLLLSNLFNPHNYSAWYLIILETDLGRLSGLVTVIELVKSGLGVDHRSIVSKMYVSSTLPNCITSTLGDFLAIMDYHMKAYEGIPVVMLILVFVSFIIFNFYFNI